MKKLSLLFVIFFNQSCVIDDDSDCRSEYLGEVKFQEESLEFLTFERDSIIVLTNAEDEKLIFSYDESLLSRVEENIDGDVFGEVCSRRPGGDPKNYSRIYFGVESARGGAYKSDLGYFEYNLVIDGYQNEKDKLDTALFDKFSLFGNINGNGFGLCMVSSNRDSAQDTFFDGDYKYLSDTVLLGKKFKDVYQSESAFDRMKFLYSPEHGIVGFKNNDELWVNMD